MKKKSALLQCTDHVQLFEPTLLHLWILLLLLLEVDAQEVPIDKPENAYLGCIYRLYRLGNGMFRVNGTFAKS